jgi:hypothetical protein
MTLGPRIAATAGSTDSAIAQPSGSSGTGCTTASSCICRVASRRTRASGAGKDEVIDGVPRVIVGAHHNIPSVLAAALPPSTIRFAPLI